MRSLKALCLIMTAVLALGVSGCRKSSNVASSQISVSESSVGTEYANSMNLLYCASDSFNPYAASTEINRRLSRLVFDPLIKLNNNFEVVYCLALSAEVSQGLCTVTLRDAQFSDGSAVTASDVVYSYNLAKASSTVYASKLYEVTSVSAADAKTVVFRLTRNDPYFVNLIDFPILKSGSEKRVNSDSVSLPPIGCGRYYVAESMNMLLQNTSHYGSKGSITQINLINAPDAESVSHYAEIGAANMYYSDISDGNIQRMSGKKATVNLNNLVYIGMNDAYGDLSNLYLRYAISSAINRRQICSDAYYNNAVAATGFFNPDFKAVSSVQNIQTEADSEITVENLEKIGYNSLNSNGVRINSAGNALKFTLLVNSENRMRVAAARTVASQLSNYGISVTVVEKSYPDYITSLASGDFQLYIGEVMITDNMDFGSIAVPGGSAAYGVGTAPAPAEGETVPEDTVSPSVTAGVIEGFYAGTNTVTDVAVVLQTQMPVIPLCYRTGVLFYSENIENVKNSSASDIYFSIDSYNIKK